MIQNAIEAVSWMLGAAVISFPLATLILNRGPNQPQPQTRDPKGGNS